MLTILLVGAAACSSVTQVQPLGRAVDPACTAAAAAYPQSVGRMPRGPVSAGAAAGAWGNPAVIARCGAPAPGPTTTECIEVDGVGWIPEKLSDGTRFTTFGTDPALEVLVPAAYDPGALLLPAFTQAAEALPANGLRCR